MLRTNHKRISILVSVLALGFSAPSFSGCNGIFGGDDVNNDGFADSVVSTETIIADSASVECVEEIKDLNTIVGTSVVGSAAMYFTILIHEGNHIKDSVISVSEVGYGNYINNSTITGDKYGGIGNENRLVGATITASDVHEVTATQGAVIYWAAVNYARLGENVTITGSSLTHSDNMEVNCSVIGASSTLEGYTTLRGPCQIGKNVYIGTGKVIYPHSFIGNGVQLFGGSSQYSSNLTIGANTQMMGGVISRYVTIGKNNYIDEDHTILNNVVTGNNVVIGTDVTINDDVIIQSNSSLGNRVEIGEKAIVLEGSSVPDDFVVSAYTIYPTDY